MGPNPRNPTDRARIPITETIHQRKRPWRLGLRKLWCETWPSEKKNATANSGLKSRWIPRNWIVLYYKTAQISDLTDADINVGSDWCRHQRCTNFWLHHVNMCWGFFLCLCIEFCSFVGESVCIYLLTTDGSPHDLVLCVPRMNKCVHDNVYRTSIHLAIRTASRVHRGRGNRHPGNTWRSRSPSPRGEAVRRSVTRCRSPEPSNLRLADSIENYRIKWNSLTRIQWTSSSTETVAFKLRQRMSGRCWWKPY